MDKKTTSRPPSLRRLAKVCGLSYQTISRILNGEIERHNKDTVKKVQKIAREMGYRRNLLARGALTGRSTTIGVFLPFSIDYEMNTRLLVGIQQVLANMGYMAVICSADGSEDDLARAYELIERRVEGVIFRAHPEGKTDQMIEEFHQHNVPVVSVVDNDPALDGVIDYIGSDEEAIGRLAAEHLWQLGHRHFGLTRVGLQRFDSMLQLRYRALTEELERYKEAYTLVTTPISSSPQPDREAIIEMLKSKPTPTAIVCSFDDIAFVVCGACAELGLSIPDQVTVLSSGNCRVLSYITPPIDSFDQNPEEIGRQAATRILQRIEHKGAKIAPKLQLIPPTLRVRSNSR